MKTVGGIKLAEITDVALIHGVGVLTASYMIKDGRIEGPATKIGNARIWTEDQVQRMQKKLKGGKAA